LSPDKNLNLLLFRFEKLGIPRLEAPIEGKYQELLMSFGKEIEIIRKVSH
jgi:hypothetical protein